MEQEILHKTFGKKKEIQHDNGRIRPPPREEREKRSHVIEVNLQFKHEILLGIFVFYSRPSLSKSF